MRVRILKAGNRIGFDPPSDDLHAILGPTLTFTSKTFLRGPELALAKEKGLPHTLEEDNEMFSFEHRGRMVTAFGYLDRVVEQFEQHGVEYEVVDLQPKPPEVYAPNWERALEDWTPRYRQTEVLDVFANYENGIISAPPGYGKTDLIIRHAMLESKARIAVVCDSAAVVTDRLYPALCLNLPAVGCIGGGQRTSQRRVMVYTMDSLHHADFQNTDIVDVDECHLAAANNASQMLVRFQKARMFGFSATVNLRGDMRDYRAEALFGPVRFHLPYQEAVEHGVVVPITVRVRDVRMDVNPAAGIHPSRREKAAIVDNLYRNRLIASDARSYPDDQVLIVVKQLKHALNLKALLPEFALVHDEGSMDRDRYARWSSQGLIPPDYRQMTMDYRRRLARDFTAGVIRGAIATTVWNVGVDFPNLGVMIRAGGDSSQINDYQLPGRVCRIGDGLKQYGIVHDYGDQFDQGWRTKYLSRESSYLGYGWDIQKLVIPGRRRRG